MGQQEKEVYMRLMWEVARFLSIEIQNYCVMGSHAHKLIFVPGKVELSDEDLLRRIQDYKGNKSREARTFEKAMELGGPIIQWQRKKYLRRMGNLSEFKKSHKQRFTAWYNRRHQRRGTLWMERFKSLLAQNSQNAKQVISTYIDLNPVRAEIVADPKDYRHCGHAAALAGDSRCREGLLQIMESKDWKRALAAYRVQMMNQGFRKVSGKSGAVSRKVLLDTLRLKGELPPSILCRLRIRYLTEGLVLGSEEFVQKTFDRYRSHFGKKRTQGAIQMKGFGGSPLRILQKIRQNPFPG